MKKTITTLLILSLITATSACGQTTQPKTNNKITSDGFSERTTSENTNNEIPE